MPPLGGMIPFSSCFQVRRNPDARLTSAEGDEPPLGGIRAALFDRQAPKPNIATTPVRLFLLATDGSDVLL